MKKRTAMLLITCILAILPAAVGMAEESKGFSLLSATDKVTLSGAIEVEAGYSSDFADVDTSEISLATAELGIDAAINDWTTGHALFKWDDDELFVDEGFITLGGTDAVPVYLTAGLLYVPFGVYETNMISDPLTLEIGETQESAVQVGVDIKGF